VNTGIFAAPRQMLKTPENTKRSKLKNNANLGILKILSISLFLTLFVEKH
jgi:hypothetical protein